MQENRYPATNILNDVLVVTTRKSFWASQESEIFPHRLYTRIVYGHSSNRLNSLLLFIRVLTWMMLRKPKLIFVGSAVRVGCWIAWIKKILGLQVKLIVMNHFFSDSVAPYVDRCIVYQKAEISLYKDSQKYVFTPLPPAGNFQRDSTPHNPPYIFSGGGSKRDFGTLIEAVKDIQVNLLLVIPSAEILGYDHPLPSNCTVEYKMPLDDFLERIAKSLFVVVPLKDGKKPHGQTTVLQAMALGKCVVTNDIPANWDYITHQQDGLLIPPEDVEALHKAITTLLNDSERRDQIGLEARKKASEWTYEGFCHFIVNLCETVLDETER